MSLIPMRSRRQKTSREILNQAEPEADLVNKIIDYARLRGWMVAHFRPAQDRNGKWLTPMQGDVGWPDLCSCVARGW